MVRTTIHTQDNKIIFSLLVTSRYGGYEDCVYTYRVGSCKTLVEVDGKRQIDETHGTDALHFELKCSGVGVSMEITLLHNTVQLLTAKAHTRLSSKA